MSDLLTVEAIYEAGQLRLPHPLPVNEGEQVKVTIALPAKKKTPAEILSAIAQMPSENPAADDFSGTDHDSILYGKE
jgi:predicted DNA-binding antitoxin AbrB/MazE fold protein